MPKRSGARRPYLSCTAIAILKLMASDLTKDFTVRGLSQGIHQDYRITYETVDRLSKNGILNLERKSHLRICRLRLDRNIQTIAFIESLRTKEFSNSKPSIRILLSTVISRLTNLSPFLCLILFGSFIRPKTVSQSDLDILLVLSDLTLQSRVENELASVMRTSTVSFHEVILSADQFLSLLSQGRTERRPNVATELLGNHIVPYGAETFYSLLSRILP